MIEPVTIDRDSFYTVDAIERTLGLRPNAVDRARLNGELRSTRRGGRVLIRGSWLEDWLVGAEQPQAELAGTAQ